jgi:hypothetical protein
MSELIIYWWCPPGSSVTREEVLRIFLAGVSRNAGESPWANVEDQIQVVLYGASNPPAFLATP